jgi:RluA family pseudouridine synthase
MDKISASSSTSTKLAQDAAESYLNIAAYKFAPLEGLAERKVELEQFCRSRAIKGTILITPEGINLFVSGTRPAIEALLAEVRRDPLLSDLIAKESYSSHQPHRRMLVKIKKEIIAFGVQGIEPASYTSRRVSPQTLKTWLDEKRPVRMLDTRNEFEVEVGTFKGAVRLSLNDFRRFSDAIDALPEDVSRELREQPVVTFCTGGIRCEKAAPFLERAGFRDIYQLDGGILKYFEDCGGAHYEGDCFVFDHRVAVNANLEETETTYCFVCQETLFAKDQKSEKYEVGVSCPYCWQRPEEKQAGRITERNAALAKLTDALPGALPYENRRPMRVPERLAGRTLTEFLTGLHTRLSIEDWERAIAAGQILLEDRPLDGSEIVRAGDVLIHVLPGTVEPEVDGHVRVLYEDDAIVVVEKPAPLPTHPSGRFSRNTLLYLLSQVYAPQKLRLVHRLDANTTGVLVLARSRKAAAALQPQFERDEVEKEYVTRIVGTPAEDTFRSDAPLTDEPGPVGGRRVDPGGRPASTEFIVRERFSDGTSLLVVRPKTGRTNQIRVHLWDLAMPVLGDPLYLPERLLGTSQTLRPMDPPLCLHAETIRFRHPLSDELVEFTSEVGERFGSPIS